MSSSNPPSLPIYFLSHGGPPILDWKHHPAYSAFQRFGKEVVNLKPKGIIVISAHFAGNRDEIFINAAEFTDLRTGFPKHYYQKKFPHKGSPELATEISEILASENIKSRLVKRGLDHGVWIPFSIAFDSNNPLEVPIVQVSIYSNENPDKHIALGKALASLRQSYVIVNSGQAVHNLRDFSFDETAVLPYVKPFDKALEAAMTENVGEEREEAMLRLLKRSDARAAHPTFDHILPIYVAIGAGSNSRGKQIFNHREGSLGWAQYRLDKM
ncbi:hypothetical protein AOL_s00112g115 [Orbilia oligospora ATCC 24927]|uniref:Extradiol ring-cleavage dioxygenase class III enzyme subunit B domain-containing protein n=1 Tax=Arthrobotrys oligospora (strain ATCC 24927 / CBS 115.81 / DSM 1491) TaxID=756982 RepID=G1XLT5_ARTOA|nr:hypothetical protein AOL_s00112g115 [Orbilia oligospora ATCC 24927]EGX45926.1 hypothetical protein AOL_s00112g115 [Orbilia oligospora ATCC 24927]